MAQRPVKSAAVPMAAGLTDPLAALVARWDAEEAILRRRGATVAADALRSCAADLHATLEAFRLEALTLTDAAAASGMSYKGLQKAVSEGRIPNAGSRHRPRIRRADLPRKATPPAGRGGPDVVGKLLGLVGSPEPSLS